MPPRTVSFTVRFFLLVFFAACLALPFPSRAAPPEPLARALQHIVDDYDRWAYTQTIVQRDTKGSVVSADVVRFDPSQPYAGQYRPLSIDGKLPTAGQLRKYRRKGEKRGQKIDAAESEGAEPVRQTLGELMDLDHATIVAEDADGIAFDVPLKKDGNTRLPPDKFRVTARVSKATGMFEDIDVVLRAPMRTDLVVKIKSGVGRLEFARVSPAFAPTLIRVHGNGAGSILFVSVGRTYDLVRSDFERVKPYNERFEVELGPLKSIDF
jgi:hypothetical protein